ncbi:hypothetical protein NEQG_02699 [Nematocida parisii ERTm3]|uniref:Uncharacterized protein n=1 Tax=Nematocida parisii (strain ERTm3) TaxID=935791 RepID=I3ED16_NEMP3|nr:hypothetical protein NEQG_02699 [Nematocida parisii ERTm3]
MVNTQTAIQTAMKTVTETATQAINFIRESVSEISLDGIKDIIYASTDEQIDLRNRCILISIAAITLIIVTCVYCIIRNKLKAAKARRQAGQTEAERQEEKEKSRCKKTSTSKCSRYNRRSTYTTDINRSTSTGCQASTSRRRKNTSRCKKTSTCKCSRKKTSRCNKKTRRRKKNTSRRSKKKTRRCR